MTQNNRIERRPTQGGIKKRQQNRVANTNVAIKIRNKGPSGRGRGKASVIRDTLKKEKPATSLDDRFSQLLKSAKRKVGEVAPLEVVEGGVPLEVVEVTPEVAQTINQREDVVVIKFQ